MIKSKSVTDVLLDWKTNSKDSGKFTEDGIIYEARWTDSKKKILFILKEPGEDPNNSCKSDSLLTLFRKWNGAKTSFTYLGRVAYGIQNATSQGYPSYEIASQNKDEAFLSTAFMNLKKTPSTKDDKSADLGKLEQYVKDHWQYIREEIEIIRPEVIVCCGDMTYPLLLKYLISSDGLGKTIILSTCHPSAWHWKDKKGITQRKKARISSKNTERIFKPISWLAARRD